MPELVTCPVCGCKAQVPDALLGRRIRCFGCNQYFTADTSPPPKPTPRRSPERSAPPPARVPRIRLDEEEAPPGPPTPLCPVCQQSAPWELDRCRYCGLEFEEDDPRRHPGPPRGLPFRRDLAPHHGELIFTLGQTSLWLGVAALVFGLATVCLRPGVVCLAVGTLVSVPLGVITWALAQLELERMRAGLVDPAGQARTEAGRGAAIAGVLLGVVFTSGFALLWLATLW